MTAAPAGIEVRQNLWAGPDGPYTIVYDVVAADGHEVNGEIHFDVGALATGSGDEAADAAGPTSDEGAWAKGRAAILPAAVLLVAGAAALLLLRRQRVGRE